MSFNKSFKQKLFHSKEIDFDALAIELFQFQASNNYVYSQYINYLGINSNDVKSIFQIPFLPISFFKNHEVKTEEWHSEKIFESSGTSKQNLSKHHIRDLDVYSDLSLDIFKRFYGEPDQYHFMALLPSYLERSGSSLIYMVSNLIKHSKSSLSGFYLNNQQDLMDDLIGAEKTDRKIFLIGVSFALLDFVEQYNLELGDAIIMETGGMKGRRKELIREDLHYILKNGFGVKQIHSEYGMTELMSQAYAQKDGLFECGFTMKILLRDLNDPFDLLEKRSQGGINVIDLGNFDTCAFIETQDIGRKKMEKIEVLGRFDNSDIRGCNLMI